MDLSQYTEAFVREQISGEIMIELDEEILKTELGITSKLHRLTWLFNGVLFFRPLIKYHHPQDKDHESGCWTALCI